MHIGCLGRLRLELACRKDRFEQDSPCRQVNRPGVGSGLEFVWLAVVEVDFLCRRWHVQYLEES